MLEQKCPYKIIIADGSGDDDKAYIQNLLEDQKYSLLDIDYFDYPYDENIKVYLEKYADISGKVKSPFAFVADNDDFLLSKKTIPSSNKYTLRKKDVITKKDILTDKFNIK